MQNAFWPACLPHNVKSRKGPFFQWVEPHHQLWSIRTLFSGFGTYACKAYNKHILLKTLISYKEQYRNKNPKKTVCHQWAAITQKLEAWTTN